MAKEHRELRCLNPTCGEIMDVVEVETSSSPFVSPLRADGESLTEHESEGDDYVICPHCGARHRIPSGGGEGPPAWDLVLEETEELEEL
ncbi:MAG: hypothetical protein Q8Q12_20180 [bacterium]|nr:hypothetical protein [bacterium]